jgi:hypothetical protein
MRKWYQNEHWNQHASLLWINPQVLLITPKINIMMYCVDEIKENLMVYKTDEDLYHHKLKAYAHLFLKFTHMPPH